MVASCLPMLFQSKERREAAAAVIHRRRMALSAAIHATLFNQTYNFRLGSSKRSRRRFRLPFLFEELASSMTDRFFRRMYRMPRAVFYKLLNRLEEIDERNTRPTLAAKLSMCLRWLSGGSYIDISVCHRVAVSSFFSNCDEIILLINRSLHILFNPADRENHERQSVAFSRGVSPLSGCVGAIDGLAVRIAEPRGSEIPNPSSYYNRKGFFAIVVQAMCDASYRFTFVSAISPGSTHDSVAFRMSSLYDLLTSAALAPGYWIAGDEAYVCAESVLTPYPGRKLSVGKDCFNYWQSSARIMIEQAFGILVGRWGILWRPLRTPISKTTLIILALTKLHNFIIDSGGMPTVPRPSGADSSGHYEPADMAVLLQDELDTDDRLHKRRRDTETSLMRDIFTKSIELNGMRRPLQA
jgi:DDE superfamily endonuclease